MYPAQGTPGGEPTADATPAAGRFPLVVYAHGLAGHPDSPFVSALAAAGYVVAAPSFPLTRFDAPGGPSGADVVNEPGDVRFVIDSLTADVALRALIDVSHIGVMGASLGATVSLALADDPTYADARVDAVAVVAGGCVGCPAGARAPGDTYFMGPPVPLLIVHGTEDPFAPYEQSVTLFHDAPAPKFFATLIGAKHIAFDEPWESVAVHALTDFFDRFLKDDTQALEQLSSHVNVTSTASLQAEPGP
jgi:dienelactone hydrolase